MVKLYRYDEKTGKWLFVDYGVRSKASEYTRQGYVVVCIWKRNDDDQRNQGRSLTHKGGVRDGL